MNILQICPPHLPDVDTLPWEIQKKSFFNIVIHILQIIYVSSEKKQVATVVLQLLLFTYCCLVLPIICIALYCIWATLQEERVY